MSMHYHYQAVKYVTFALGGAGVALNALTLAALTLTKAWHLGPYLVLLKSLTTADLLVSVHLLLHKALREDYFDCAYTVFFYPCSPLYIATYLTLVLIAVNLYLAVVRPLDYPRVVTRRRVVLVVVLCWVSGVLTYSIDLFRALYDHMSGTQQFCRAFENYRSGFLINPVMYLTTLEWSWVFFMVLVYTGLVYMTVLYVRIYMVARKSLQSSPGMAPTDVRERREKRNSIYTSLLLLGSFLLVYLPFCVAYTCFQVYRVYVLQATTQENGTATSKLGAIYNYLEIYMEPVLVLNVIYATRLSTSSG